MNQFKSTTECIQKFNDLEPFDIYEWVKALGLPICDYTVRTAHKIRNTAMNVKRYAAQDLKGLADMDLKDLNKMLKAINNTDLASIHQQLTLLDKVLDNTH